MTASISATRITAILSRRDELQSQLASGDLPPDRFVALSKEYAEVEPVAEAAAEEGIKIYTIGVGTTAGVRIPLKRAGVLQSYKRDQDNQVVITKLNKETLQEIAQAANGEYLDGSNTKELVEKVQNILAGMDKKEFDAKQFSDFKDQFQWFLGFAIFFLLIDILFLERKTAWLKKLNLFNENF